MVEKKEIIPDEGYLTRLAVKKKEIPAEIRFPHARESVELNEAMNCKMTVEKKLTRDQFEAYNQILQKDRQKEKNREYRRNYRVKQGKDNK